MAAVSGRSWKEEEKRKALFETKRLSKRKSWWNKAPEEDRWMLDDSERTYERWSDDECRSATKHLCSG